jgi:hypothetical protein
MRKILWNVAIHLRQGYGGQDVEVLPIPMLPFASLGEGEQWEIQTLGG